MMYLLYLFNVLSCMFKAWSLSCGHGHHPTCNLRQEENQQFFFFFSSISGMPEFSIGIASDRHGLRNSVLMAVSEGKKGQIGR